MGDGPPGGKMRHAPPRLRAPVRCRADRHDPEKACSRRFFKCRSRRPARGSCDADPRTKSSLAITGATAARSTCTTTPDRRRPGGAHLFRGRRASGSFRRFADRARRLFEAFEAPVMLAERPSLPAAGGACAEAPRPDPPTWRRGAALRASPCGQFSPTHDCGSLFRPLRPPYGRRIALPEPRGAGVDLGIPRRAASCGSSRMHRLAVALRGCARQGRELPLQRQKAARSSRQDGRVCAVPSGDGNPPARRLIVLQRRPKALVERTAWPRRDGRGSRHPASRPRRPVGLCLGFRASLRARSGTPHRVLSPRPEARVRRPLAAGRCPRTARL